MLRVLLFRGHAVPAEAGLLLIALSWMTQKVERHLGRDCRNGRRQAAVGRRLVCGFIEPCLDRGQPWIVEHDVIGDVP